MKTFVVVVAVGMVGAAFWFVVGGLSSDAVGLIIGLLFGILAGVPPALLALATTARRNMEDSPFRQPPPPVHQPPALLSGPTVIVFDNGDGRRVQLEFATPDAARRFLAERGVY